MSVSISEIMCLRLTAIKEGTVAKASVGLDDVAMTEVCNAILALNASAFPRTGVSVNDATVLANKALDLIAENDG